MASYFIRYSYDWMFLSSDLCKLAYHSLRPTKYYLCQSAVSLASRSFFCTTADMTMRTEFTHISFTLRAAQQPSMSTELRATHFLCISSYAITNSLFSHMSRTNTITITRTKYYCCCNDLHTARLAYLLTHGLPDFPLGTH
jgi:hypothetical protein